MIWVWSNFLLGWYLSFCISNIRLNTVLYAYLHYLHKSSCLQLHISYLFSATLISSSFSAPLSAWRARELPLLPFGSNSLPIWSPQGFSSPSVDYDHSFPFPAGGGQPPGVQWPDVHLTHLPMLWKPLFFMSHTCLPVSLIPMARTVLKIHLLQSWLCREVMSSVTNAAAGTRPQLSGTWDALVSILSILVLVWIQYLRQGRETNGGNQGKQSSKFPLANVRIHAAELSNMYLEWDQSYFLPSPEVSVCPL